ncbi:hypothetical protein D1970_04720 [Mesobacillus zeae]|uniref:Uncharacterized protein n=1 Tax=Mesobacillus zeae TaxID=1917180 RepID=A0A398BJB8_9BACI|nr:hypothetical protein D1970_04720 [Mesobacillus zeae]
MMVLDTLDVLASSMEIKNLCRIPAKVFLYKTKDLYRLVKVLLTTYVASKAGRNASEMTTLL